MDSVCVFVCVCVSVSDESLCVDGDGVIVYERACAYLCISSSMHVHMTESPTSETFHHKNERRDEGSRGDNC